MATSQLARPRRFPQQPPRSADYTHTHRGPSPRAPARSPAMHACVCCNGATWRWCGCETSSDDSPAAPERLSNPALCHVRRTATALAPLVHASCAPSPSWPTKRSNRRPATGCNRPMPRGPGRGMPRWALPMRLWCPAMPRSSGKGGAMRHKKRELEREQPREERGGERETTKEDEGNKETVGRKPCGGPSWQAKCCKDEGASKWLRGQAARGA